MRRLTIVLALALWATGASAQSTVSYKDMAKKTAKIAESLFSTAKNFQGVSSNMLEHENIMEVAPKEAALAIEATEDARKAVLRRARAYELLSLKLSQLALEQDHR